MADIGEMKIEQLSIDKIVANEWNPNVMDDETFNRLAEEIEEVGFVDPIQVVPMDDGTYRIIGGEHRWRALRILGYEEIPCFPPGTTIETADGLVDIEDVQIGDVVFDKDGNRREVIQKHCRAYSGDVVTINSVCWNTPVVATTNHPFFVLDKLKGISKKRADEIVVGDELYFAPIQKDSDSSVVDLSEELEFLRSKHPRVLNQIPDKWDIDVDLGWWIGMYISEGSASGGKNSGIRFTLGSHEQEYADRIVRITKEKFGLDASIYRYENSNAIKIAVYNMHLYPLLSDLFGSNCYSKSMPWSWLWSLSNQSLMHIVEGIKDGDGHVGRGDRVTVHMTSRELAYQLFRILGPVGHGPSICRRDERLDCNGIKHAESWHVMWNNIGSQGMRSLHVDGGMIVKVKSVERHNYDGDVYNLGVDTEHSYRANGYAVANCVILGDEKWKDTDLQKFVTMRLNAIRGKINPQKFIEMYNDLADRYEEESLQALMGVADDDAWKQMTKDVRKGLKEAGAPKEVLKKFDESTKELKTVDDLSTIINKAFTEFGDTLDKNFMWFSFGSKNHLYVQCEKPTWGIIRGMMKTVEAEKLDASKVFGAVLKNWKNYVDLNVGQVIGDDGKVESAKKEDQSTTPA